MTLQAKPSSLSVTKAKALVVLQQPAAEVVTVMVRS
jgi:hypothetical protein